VIRAYLPLAAVAVILCLLGWTWIQGARLDAARSELAMAEQTNVSLLAAQQAKDAALAGALAEIAARDAALAERDRQVAEIDKQRAAALRTLKEAQRHDSIVQAWADTPVPAAVRELLR